MAGGRNHGEGNLVPGEDDTSLTRYEEVLDVGREWVEDDVVRARTRIETVRVDNSVPRHIVYADTERTGPEPEDDGEVHTLADGSISVPVLEEQIVVTKRTVVRERVILRRRVVTETVRVEDELRREHIEVEAAGGVEVVERREATAPSPGGSAGPDRRPADHHGQTAPGPAEGLGQVVQGPMPAEGQPVAGRPGQEPSQRAGGAARDRERGGRTAPFPGSSADPRRQRRAS